MQIILKTFPTRILQESKVCLFKIKEAFSGSSYSVIKKKSKTHLVSTLSSEKILDNKVILIRVREIGG